MKQVVASPSLRHAVQRRVLFVQVLDVDARVQGRAGHRLAQLIRRRIERTDVVNLLPEPVPDWRELTRGDEVVEVTPRKQPANQPKIDPDAMPGQDGESGMSNVSGQAAENINK